MGALGYNKEFSEIVKQNYGWLAIILLILIACLSICAFDSGRSYEANSMDTFWSGTQNQCAIRAYQIEMYTGLDVTSNLKLKECNSINWLYKKVQQGQGVFVWVGPFD